MSIYHNNLTQRFVENFTQDIICHFPDGYNNGTTDIGSSYFNMSTFDQVPSQPDNDYFMTLVITDSSTFNDSITDGSIKYKRSLAFVDFSILWPVSLSRKRLDTEIEPALDSLFMNYSYRAIDESELYSQQDSPKDIVRVKRAEGDDKWNSKTIRYPFVIRHI